MWARRLGAPPSWPSRVKVFLYSMGTAAIGWTIYSFMASSNVGYLDLGSPSQDRVLCVTSWPGRSEARTWWNERSWGDWVQYQADMERYLANKGCLVPDVRNATCDVVSVPLHQVQSTLGAPLTLGERSFDLGRSFASRDALSIYAHLFLVLSICLWLAISFHDQALLHTVNKNYVLDLMGIAREFPRFHTACGYLMGFSLMRQLLYFNRTCTQRLTGFVLAALIVPVLMAWRFLLFMFVVCPLSGILFFCYPVRTSRIWTFLICMASMVYGVCLSIHMTAFLVRDELRPRYAVTWKAHATMTPSGREGTCDCGCVFPLSDITCVRLLMIGLLAAVKSFVIAFRCLKGLRRSNWANLMSVTFSFPVNAYTVEWTRPDGGPIKGRAEGQPVQSELAFDPFALMDEQPESANSHVTLKPSSVLSWEVDESSGQHCLRQISKRNLQGPCAPNFEDVEAAPFEGDVEVLPVEYIGCCGFPFRTGGIQGRLNLAVSDPIDVYTNSVQDLAGPVSSPNRLVPPCPSSPSKALPPSSLGAPLASPQGNLVARPRSTPLARTAQGLKAVVLGSSDGEVARAQPGDKEELSLLRVHGVRYNEAPAAGADLLLPRLRLGLAGTGSPEPSPTHCGREAKVSTRFGSSFLPVVATRKTGDL